MLLKGGCSTFLLSLTRCRFIGSKWNPAIITITNHNNNVKDILHSRGGTFCRTMKVYTKTGDKGYSSLFSGERRRKSDERFHALGSTDELSSSIGLSIAFAEEQQHDFVADLLNIQCVLQDVGSFVATPKATSREAHTARLHFDSNAVTDLENAIDRMTEELPPLTNFILPSGGKTSSSLHQARSLCRRAERHLAGLLINEELEQDVFRYINRLSDYLFTLARYAAMKEGKSEHIYRPIKER